MNTVEGGVYRLPDGSLATWGDQPAQSSLWVRLFPFPALSVIYARKLLSRRVDKPA